MSPCLSDLTTTGLLAAGGNGTYTDSADFAGLHPAGTLSPSGVPGVQVDGCYPDTSSTNTLHGWNHDAQFVIRLPERWNGRLVVAGAPRVRKQYSSDVMVSDRVLARGFACASIDKGNTGAFFFRDGARQGDAMREWHARTTQVARAAQAVVRQAYGRPARHTYMTGVSNGGYLTRWQLENEPGVFDGVEAGITPTCPLGALGCAVDLAYDVTTRPAVAEALRGLTLTGKLKRPLLSLHGDLDTLLPIDLHGTRYAELVAEQKRSRLHRLHVVERGQHVDSFVTLFLEGAMLPCDTDAFDALVAWVERGVEPPASGPVEPAAGAAVDDCTLQVTRSGDPRHAASSRPCVSWVTRRTD